MFCSHYFEPQVETRFTRADRNDEGSEVESEGKLPIFTHSGRPLGRRSSERYLTDKEYKAASNYVLFNCAEIAPYLE